MAASTPERCWFKTRSFVPSSFMPLLPYQQDCLFTHGSGGFNFLGSAFGLFVWADVLGYISKN
jgi:hypothetical protein